ncbi:DUF1403 family protein [uncultured Tateyamaria sp.]|uniref:DUF1403 family protein n=1 Tax=uncultured Tateyamaria sp. TaxID=455651 RepID=UPI0026346A67|nr:DUF1403 family protein [uncultured Tateyamaria sp.]
MTYQPAAIDDDLNTLPKLPGWVTSLRAETLETVAFRSGAALMVLDALVSDPRYGVPVKLLANCVALKAAAATSKLQGRMAREGDIRDAFHLTPPGEARGPDGDLLAFWREAARMRLTGRDWQVVLKGFVGSEFEMDVDVWLQSAVAHSRTHGPLAGCVAVVRAVLAVDDRAERAACLLSDIVLARCLNWPMILPVSALNLTKAVLRDLVGNGQGADLAVQQRLLQSTEEAIRLARDLAQRGAALQVVAPKLRAKGSDAAVALFLSEDAVAPSTMLSPLIQGTGIPMTDRAARRFCDRLMEMGVARELTGRPTFRLYGIAP